MTKKKTDEFDSDEQRDAYIAGLRVELATNRAQGYAENEKQVLAELSRLGVHEERTQTRQTRPRAQGAQKRGAG